MEGGGGADIRKIKRKISPPRAQDARPIASLAQLLCCGDIPDPYQSAREDAHKKVDGCLKFRTLIEELQRRNTDEGRMGTDRRRPSDSRTLKRPLTMAPRTGSGGKAAAGRLKRHSHCRLHDQPYVVHIAASRGYGTRAAATGIGWA